MVETVLHIDLDHLAKIFKVKKERECIIEAIAFFVTTLGLKNEIETISFKSGRFQWSKHTGECNSSIHRKEFRIWFAGKGDGGNRKLHHVLQTIAHELIHVKQYMFDGLHEAFKMNQKISKDRKISYSKSWWELEASSREVELVYDFIKHLDKNS